MNSCRKRLFRNFITLEGGEGAGKSTLLTSLGTSLRAHGLEVVTTREPGGCALAERLRSLLLEQKATEPRAELLLFLAGRAQHVTESILPALSAGKVVLCDRFIDSTIAYQSGARGLERDLVELCSLFASQGVHPGLTLLLDLEVSQGCQRASQRSGNNHFDQETLFFHERVRHAFLRELASDPARVRGIDATSAPKVIHDLAEQLILNHLATTDVTFW